MKSKMLLAIMSLSFMMGTLPIQAQDSTYRDMKKDFKKIVRCSWHIAKMGTGCLSSLLGVTALASTILLRSHKDTVADIIVRIFDLNQTENDEKFRKNLLKSGNWFIGGFGLTTFVTGIVTTKKGYDDFKKELSDSKKAPEKNKNKDEQSEEA